MVTGSIMMYPSATPPTGFLICDGSAVSRATYAALFAIVGTSFGAGNGSTTFNVPDTRTRFPIGASGTAPLASTGGQFDHVHTTPDISGSTGPADSPVLVDSIEQSVSVSSADHLHAFEVLADFTGSANPPYLGVAFMIKT